MVYYMNILFRSDTGRMSADLAQPGPTGPFIYGPDPFPVTHPLYEYGSPYTFAPCTVCSIRHGERIIHRHHSSIYFAENTLRLYGPTIKCPTCKIQHDGQAGERTIALFTTSTLHNVYLEPELRMSFHMDIESICGGKTVQLYKAWKVGYKNITKPQDIIVLAGLNDVKTVHKTGGDGRGYMNLLKLWDHEVKEANPRHKQFTLINSFRTQGK